MIGPRRSGWVTLCVGLCATGSLAQAQQLASPASPQEPEQPEQAPLSVQTKAPVGGALERGPSRVESLRAEDLERRGVTDLAQALQWLSAGASINPTGTSSGLVVDGLGTAQLTVLRDGMMIARQAGSPQGPVVDLSAIGVDPSIVERIDVYRGMGPAGSAGASGVVIDIITRRARPQSRVSAQGQWLSAPQDALARQTYTVTGRGAMSSAWVGDASAQWDDLNALDVNDDQRPDSPQRRRLSAEGRLTWRPSANSSLSAAYLFSDMNARSIGAPQAPLDDQIDSRRHDARLAGQWWLGQDLRLDHQLSARVEQHTFSKLVRSSGFVRPKADTAQTHATQSATLTWFVGQHDLSLESSLEGLTVERSGETGQLPQVRQGALGLGVGDTWRLGQGHQLQGRAWLDAHSSFGASAQGQVGGLIDLGAGFALRPGLAHTRRRPTPEELFLSFDHSEVGYQIQGNEGLRPERLSTARVGVLWSSADQRLGVEAEAFIHELDEVIVIASSAQDASIFTYANAGQARTAGLNASTHLRALPWQLELLGTYTALPVAKDRSNDQRLPLRPTHAARVEVRQPWLDGALEVWIDASWRSALVVPQGSPPAPRQVILGAGAAWRPWSNLRLMADLNNLLDERHPTWGPTPGLHGLISAQLSWDEAP